MSGTVPARHGFIDVIEEGFIAILLGLMTAITFANVIARYVFNSNILWALEATVYLFAWMVLIGASYCVKINAHLGIDILVRVFPPKIRKIMTLFAVACCLLFSALLLYGAWTYWIEFLTNRAWYEVNDVPMPDWLRFIEPMLNENERYTYIPRFIPYFALPLGMGLLLFRYLQVAWRVATDRQELIVASHEAEDEIEAAADRATHGESAESIDPRARGGR